MLVLTSIALLCLNDNFKVTFVALLLTKNTFSNRFKKFKGKQKKRHIAVPLLKHKTWKIKNYALASSEGASVGNSIFDRIALILPSNSSANSGLSSINCLTASLPCPNLVSP